MAAIALEQRMDKTAEASQKRHAQATLLGRAGRASYRATARTVGALFLAAILAYGVGNGLIVSALAAPDHLSSVTAHSTQVAAGALLMVINSAVVAAIGVMLVPVLRQHSERVALGYLGSRIIESVLLAVGVVFLLLQLPLGREYLDAGVSARPYLQALSTLSVQANHFAYQMGMIAVGVGGVMLGYVLYGGKLVPRLVAVWGLVGYAIFLSGAVLEILGFSVGLMLAIPGGLWELFIGVWLIAKGFKAPATVSGAAAPATPSR